jgi:hypothetical protein
VTDSLPENPTENSTPTQTQPRAGGLRPGEIGALQRELRSMLTGIPIQAGILPCLARLSEFFDAGYLTIQARFGPVMLSEEWVEEEEFSEIAREPCTELMWESLSSGRIKCRRSGRGESSQSLYSTPIFDEHMESIGALGMATSFASKEESLRVLGIFEGIIGVLGLQIIDELASDEDAPRAKNSAREEDPPEKATLRHPVRIAYELVAHVKNRYGLDQSALGFVRGNKVEIVSICGLDQVRSSNPGIKVIRAAMEESLDLAKPLLWQEVVLGVQMKHDSEHLLHRQWSKMAGGDSVASIPLYEGDECVAVLSVRSNPMRGLDWGELEAMARDAQPYCSLLPIARLAHRGPLRHILDSTRSGIASVIGQGARRSASLTVLIAALVLWLAFGTLPFSVTVPSTLIGAISRTVSSPREGVLQKSFVEPGTLVKKGQLLAQMDAREDILRRAELQAQIRTFGALGDRALSEGVPGQGRVLEAQLGELRAELAVVELRIRQADIRATMSGLVLEGDLAKRIGGRLGIGEKLFTITSAQELRVEMKIPERWYEAGTNCEQLEFTPSAHPSERVSLANLRIAPVSEIHDKQNVFIGRSTGFEAPSYLQPGMTGVTNLDLGYRPVWWVMSHRVVDWLRMRFVF